MIQADGNTTGVNNPTGYCYNEQPAWSAYREPSFGYSTPLHPIFDCMVEELHLL